MRLFLRAGFTTFDRNASYYGLGVTLGNAEVRLDELVAAYSAFARGGSGVHEEHAAESSGGSCSSGDTTQRDELMKKITDAKKIEVKAE